MNSQQVIDLFMGLIYATAELSLPLLATALVVGLIISIFQAATQINEATLSFLPKIAAMIAVFAIMSPWMVRRMTTYTQDIFKKIPEITRQK
ncbi:MAG: flagellar biosynthetic protein FliQ [Pseudomonadota bacterium]|jgi:flagellar biosynthetic protein FliQ